MIKKLVILLLCLQAAMPGKAQQFVSPYKLSLAVDIPISSNAIGFMAASFMVGHTKHLPPKDSLLTLNRSQVNRFDRGATYNSSRPAGYVSDGLLFASVATPLIHLGNTNARKDFGKIAAIGAEVFMLNVALTSFVKEMVRRKRPLVYNPEVPWAKKYKADSFKSFFSGHTSTVAAMSFFFAQSFSDYNPDSKLKPMVWTICAVMPVLTGFLRFKAGKHYWTDIITGYVVGALCGIGVPYLHSAALSINR